ncbi:hypothetical protein JH06_2019 [Blastocystis sp. subtype 4]|uniref:hypothetical protein n=1 Tax=Blastocystis sp. subtype 4 TaxID=944170 RepID=UPI000711CA10|nr:hypothetical protein JH06_2019 [Blastocystis sp. subtype 4]KNB45303.1 hypothetical protein JH06_2019 [Blastocystis sp. subtype 4]|eukprot:XP_014528746.1 hypothetical protein JH06_2019 [Blastocystis sp. subtype 4]
MQYIQISDAERKKVNKFRKLIKNTGKGKVFLGCIGLSIDLPDESLYRYLVSSNYGVVPALRKLTNMITWRDTHHIDTLLSDMYVKQLVSILSKKLRFTEHGYDSLNRPLTIMAVGAFNLCEILKVIPIWCTYLKEYEIEDILLVFYYYTEYIEKKCQNISKHLGRDYTGNVTIMDMEGLSLRTHFHPKAITIFRTIVLANTYCYPESCQQVYIVNSPPIFSFFWSLILPIMNKMQYSKMKVINDVKEFLEFFPSDQLPSRYGGSCHCPAESILFDNVKKTGVSMSGVLRIPPNGIGKAGDRCDDHE